MDCSHLFHGPKRSRVGRPAATSVVDCDPYYKYSTIFHQEGLPSVCLLHGIDDELSPFSQSVQLAEELERHWHPHKFYSSEGLSHYSTSADNATTCNWRSVAWQMFQDSLDCLRRWLEDK